MKEPDSERNLIEDLDERFARLHRNACHLLMSDSAAALEGQPRESDGSTHVDSWRQRIVRGAAIVEQTFGGITANLWDDPFEWTLPETLDTRQRILEYLEEVEATRKRAFEGFSTDSELSKKVAVPSGELQTLLNLLMDTLARAEDHKGRDVPTRANDRN
ncbi:MAG: hypothetical protein ABJC05_09845 [Pyrinomonadaceae bacterium]